MEPSLILDLLTTASVMVGAYVAIKGLGEWKKQLTGNSEYDLARRVLIKTFRFRDTFNQARNPFMNLNTEKGTITLLQAEQRAFQLRIDLLDSAWSELYLEILESEALYGKEQMKVFDELRQIKQSFKADIWLYFWLKGASPGVTVDNNPQRVRENEINVFQQSTDPEEDTILKKLIQAVTNIELFYREKLKV